MQIIIKSLRRKNAVTCIFTIITCYCSHYHNIMSNIYVDCNRHFCGKFHSCFFASEKERKLIYWIKSLMWILYCTGVIIFDNLRLVRNYLYQVMTQLWLSWRLSKQKDFQFQSSGEGTTFVSRKDFSNDDIQMFYKYLINRRSLYEKPLAASLTDEDQRFALMWLLRRCQFLWRYCSSTSSTTSL